MPDLELSLLLNEVKGTLGETNEKLDKVIGHLEALQASVDALGRTQRRGSPQEYELPYPSPGNEPMVTT